MNNPPQVSFLANKRSVIPKSVFVFFRAFGVLRSSFSFFCSRLSFLLQLKVHCSVSKAQLLDGFAWPDLLFAFTPWMYQLPKAQPKRKNKRGVLLESGSINNANNQKGSKYQKTIAVVTQSGEMPCSKHPRCSFCSPNKTSQQLQEALLLPPRSKHLCKWLICTHKLLCSKNANCSAVNVARESRSDSFLQISS